MAEDNPDMDMIEFNNKPVVCPATAVFIKSESGDSYLYNFSRHLSQEVALKYAQLICPEEPEYWAEHLVSWTSLSQEQKVLNNLKGE